MELHIGCIPGDGIGPEIVGEARKVLDRVAEKFGHTIQYTEILLGGASIDVHGVPLTEEAIEAAKSSDAVLMAPSAEMPTPPPGISCRRRNVRKQDCSPSGRRWACSPICVRRYCMTNWREPAR